MFQNHREKINIYTLIYTIKITVHRFAKLTIPIHYASMSLTINKKLNCKGINPIFAIIF